MNNQNVSLQFVNKEVSKSVQAMVLSRTAYFDKSQRREGKGSKREQEYNWERCSLQPKDATKSSSHRGKVQEYLSHSKITC